MFLTKKDQGNANAHMHSFCIIRYNVNSINWRLIGYHKITENEKKNRTFCPDSVFVDKMNRLKEDTYCFPFLLNAMCYSIVNTSTPTFLLALYNSTSQLNGLEPLLLHRGNTRKLHFAQF